MKKTILFLLLAVMSSALRAEGKFSLLTCAPGEKIYELFGHTAIRYVEGDSIDLVFNYGMFNFNSPNFIYRFVKGETDYELGIDVYRSFEYSYRRRGSAVYEQKLNLTPDETIMLLHSLLENYKPENRVYRYNYFYDNCTTRAKDMIEKAISGTVEFEPWAEDRRNNKRRWLGGKPHIGHGDDCFSRTCRQWCRLMAASSALCMDAVCHCIGCRLFPETEKLDC